MTYFEDLGLTPLTGDITVEMVVNGNVIKMLVNGLDAPVTSSNFVDLVERGIYNATKFHRIEPGFVTQGGDPQSKDPTVSEELLGTGGFIDPATDQERNIPLEIKPAGADEPIYSKTLAEAEITAEPLLPHVKGAIAMARTNDPDTASSQFYFALDDLSQLDGSYAVFGGVTEGMDVVENIAKGDAIQFVAVTSGNVAGRKSSLVTDFDLLNSFINDTNTTKIEYTLTTAKQAETQDDSKNAENLDNTIDQNNTNITTETETLVEDQNNELATNESQETSSTEDLNTTDTGDTNEESDFINDNLADTVDENAITEEIANDSISGDSIEDPIGEDSNDDITDGIDDTGADGSNESIDDTGIDDTGADGSNESIDDTGTDDTGTDDTGTDDTGTDDTNTDDTGSNESIDDTGTDDTGTDDTNTDDTNTDDTNTDDTGTDDTNTDDTNTDDTGIDDTGTDDTGTDDTNTDNTDTDDTGTDDTNTDDITDPTLRSAPNPGETTTKENQDQGTDDASITAQLSPEDQAFVNTLLGKTSENEQTDNSKIREASDHDSTNTTNDSITTTRTAAIMALGGDDQIRGTNDNNVMNGNEGDDDILGVDGHDFLRGGKGNDQVSGGLGNDFLVGDYGIDTLTGNEGIDNFILRASTEKGVTSQDLADVIADFSVTDGDRISVIADFITETDLVYEASGNDTILKLGTSGDILALVKGATQSIIEQNISIIGTDDIALTRIG